MQLLDGLTAGAQLALRFNPVFALPAAAAAAAVLARRSTPGRFMFAAMALLAGWLLGDGMRALAAARDLYDGAGALLPSAPVWANAEAVLLWALGGLLLGYVVPAWTGVFVGRRVTWGTGVIAAIAVSVMCSGAIAVISGSLA